MKNYENIRELVLKKKIAAFDVDGTITFTDSFMLFLRFTTSKWGFIAKLTALLPFFILYIFKIYSRDDVKNRILNAFLHGKNTKEYKEYCVEFSEIYAKILRSDALKAIESHKVAGHELALVSASLEDYLIPFANSLGIKNVIATKLEIKDDVLTGKMLGPNCRAQEKLNRIYQYFGDVEIIAAYGDSRGDKEMIEAAKEKHYRTLIDEPKNKGEIVRELYLGGGLIN